MTKYVPDDKEISSDDKHSDKENYNKEWIYFLQE